MDRVKPDTQTHNKARLARLASGLRLLVWLTGTLSAVAAVLRWLLADVRAWLPPTLAAQMPSGSMGIERRLAGLCVELVPLVAALYTLIVLYGICGTFVKGELFGASTVQAYRKFGVGLILLGAANGMYTALITIVLTYSPGAAGLKISLGLSTADLYLIVVGVAVVMLGYVMHEARRIQEDNSLIV